VDPGVVALRDDVNVRVVRVGDGAGAGVCGEFEELAPTVRSRLGLDRPGREGHGDRDPVVQQREPEAGGRAREDVRAARVSRVLGLGGDGHAAVVGLGGELLDDELVVFGRRRPVDVAQRVAAGVLAQAVELLPLLAGSERVVGVQAAAEPGRDRAHFGVDDDLVLLVDEQRPGEQSEDVGRRHLDRAESGLAAVAVADAVRRRLVADGGPDGLGRSVSSGDPVQPAVEPVADVRDEPPLDRRAGLVAVEVEPDLVFLADEAVGEPGPPHAGGVDPRNLEIAGRERDGPRKHDSVERATADHDRHRPGGEADSENDATAPGERGSGHASLHRHAVERL
jgi:hypothetical protein